MIAGLAVCIALTLAAWITTDLSRPSSCPKGHTDHYLTSSGWRCRQCAIEAEKRGLRRLARERNR